MRHARGFTLLEVLVAIAIMALIMVLLWSSTSQSLRAKERIENRDAVFHEGGVALRKLADDLTMAYLARQAATSAQPGATPAAAGTTTPAAAGAAAEPFKTFFIGKDGGEADGVSFTALSHLRLFKNAKESDQCRVAYELVPSEAGGKQMNLVRREDPWFDATTDVKGDPVVLVENIAAFNVEYYDLRSNEWVRSWNTEQQDWQGQLPLAVRATIAFVDPNDEERTIPMSTAVMLPMSKGAIEF